MITQISLLDHPELIGTAHYGVRISPADLAARDGLTPERSFDDLGYYDFLGVQTEEGLVGFRMHTGSQTKYSYVSLQGLRPNTDPKRLIGRICEIPPSEVSEFDEGW